jgi:DNA-binding HxlR family transcriptional regulator
VNRADPADLPGRACSVAAALDVVGDRWSLLVVREVSFGHHRFSEILAGTGAPRDRLTARLKLLVEVGVLDRRPYQDNPPRAEYHLTAAGGGLLPVLHALRQWGDDNVVTRPPVRLIHGSDDHEARGEWTCITCGQPLRGSHAHLEPVQP